MSGSSTPDLLDEWAIVSDDEAYQPGINPSHSVTRTKPTQSRVGAISLSEISVPVEYAA